MGNGSLNLDFFQQVLEPRKRDHLKNLMPLLTLIILFYPYGGVWTKIIVLLVSLEVCFISGMGELVKSKVRAEKDKGRKYVEEFKGLLRSGEIFRQDNWREARRIFSILPISSKASKLYLGSIAVHLVTYVMVMVFALFQGGGIPYALFILQLMVIFLVYFSGLVKPILE